MPEFTATEIADFVRGLASPSVAARLEREIERNPALAKRVSLLREVAATGQRPEPLAAPEAWMADAFAIARDRRVGRAASLLGRLVFDSWAQPAAGFRGGGLEARDLRYETDSLAVDLRLEPEASTVYVTGVAAGAVRVEVLDGDVSVATAAVESDGTFSVEFLAGEGGDLLVFGADGSSVLLEGAASFGELS